jgi:hypothetical protein
MAAQLIFTKVRARRPLRSWMARDELLAGAGLPEDEHGRVGGCDDLHLLQGVVKRGAVADDLLERALGPDLALEIQPLRRELVLELRDLPVRHRVGDRDRDLAGHLLDERHGRRRERAGLDASDGEHAERVVADDQRHAAHRVDAHLAEDSGRLGGPGRHLLLAEDLCTARGEGPGAGCAGNRRSSALDRFRWSPGPEGGRVHYEVVAPGFRESERREVVRDHALEQRGYDRKDT